MPRSTPSPVAGSRSRSRRKRTRPYCGSKIPGSASPPKCSETSSIYSCRPTDRWIVRVGGSGLDSRWCEVSWSCTAERSRFIVPARAPVANSRSGFPLLRCHSPAPARHRAPANSKARPIRILIVDDNRDSARTLARVLELDGHEVFCVYDGLSVTEQVVSFHPDVVLLDIGLPGWTAIKSPRSSDDDSPRRADARGRDRIWRRRDHRTPSSPASTITSSNRLELGRVCKMIVARRFARTVTARDPDASLASSGHRARGASLRRP